MKLYTISTTDRKKDELLAIPQDNMINITFTFRHNSNNFGWGIFTNTIVRASGNPLRILEDFQACTLALVCQEADKTWNDYAETTRTIVLFIAIESYILGPGDVVKPDALVDFHRCVHSKMIVKHIKSSLPPSS